MVSGFSYSHPSSLDTLHSPPSKQQLKPQTQDGRCAYALSDDFLSFTLSLLSTFTSGTE